MRSALKELQEHLQILKKEGDSFVYWEDKSLEKLKEQVLSRTPNVPPAPLPESKANVSVQPAIEPRKKREVPQIKIDTSITEAKPERKIIINSQKDEEDIPEPPVFDIPSGNKKTQWEWLRDKVLNCPVCNQHVKPGKKVVFGVGNIDADIFFCGEAPGADEETQGEPFVGKAGQLLTKIINATGLKREDVYIGNIMNWRPEMPTLYGNRPPTQKEMDFCLPYLKAQVQIIKPQVIVALGATAVNGLLGADSKRKMADVRGEWHEFEGTPMMITFHPSYLLRNNTNKAKRKVWEDFLLVMERVSLPIAPKQRDFFL